MSLVLIANLPTSSPVIEVGIDDKPTGLMSSAWLEALFSLQQRQTNSPQVVNNPVTFLQNQSADIAPTQFPFVVISGVYRLSWYARITQAASTSSSFRITFAWSDQGQTCTASGIAMVGNTITSTQSDQLLVRADAASVLTYATTRLSVGGTPMQYALTVMAEYLGQ